MKQWKQSIVGFEKCLIPWKELRHSKLSQLPNDWSNMSDEWWQSYVQSHNCIMKQFHWICIKTELTDESEHLQSDLINSSIYIFIEILFRKTSALINK